MTAIKNKYPTPKGPEASEYYMVCYKNGLRATGSHAKAKKYADSCKPTPLYFKAKK